MRFQDTEKAWLEGRAWLGNLGNLKHLVEGLDRALSSLIESIADLDGVGTAI